MEKPDFRPQLEQKEKKEMPEIKILIYSNSPVGKALKQVMGVFFKGTELVEDEDSLVKKLESGNNDVVILDQYSMKETIENIKKITTIRNKPQIINQPVIITFGQMRLSEKDLQKISDAGSDIVINDVAQVVTKLLSSMQSVPELLGKIEDEYGDKMLKNKKGFYKEYQDKLSARSEVTADTEQELAILESAFKEGDVKTVLDAGGGEGRIAIPLSEKGYDVTNFDSSEDLVNKMKNKNNNIKGVVADLKKPPIKDQSFDAITYNWHVFADILGNKAKHDVLKQAHRVLKDNGIIMLDLPDREEGEFKKDGVYINDPGGESIFIGYIPSEEEMIRFLEEAGFKDIEIKKWKTKNGFPKISFKAKK